MNIFVVSNKCTIKSNPNLKRKILINIMLDLHKTQSQSFMLNSRNIIKKNMFFYKCTLNYIYTRVFLEKVYCCNNNK